MYISWSKMSIVGNMVDNKHLLKTCVKANPRNTIQKLVLQLDVSNWTFFNHLHQSEDEQNKKYNWVSHELTKYQKYQQVDIYNHLLFISVNIATITPFENSVAVWGMKMDTFFRNTLVIYNFMLIMNKYSSSEHLRYLCHTSYALYCYTFYVSFDLMKQNYYQVLNPFQALKYF